MNDVKIFGSIVEDEAIKQINTISSLTAFENAKIRIMPDVHAGKGCVCGFTANLGNKVVPNLVGVDIGCGMLTINLGKIDIDFKKLDDVIHSEIPSGMKVHNRVSNFIDIGYDIWDCNPESCIAKLQNKDYSYFKHSVGTLGGGNHFIEIDANEKGDKFLVIHTGSRNFGKKVCDYWQNIAVRNLTKPIPDLKQLIKDVKIRCVEENRRTDIQKEVERVREEYKRMVDDSLPDNKDLAYLEGDYRDNYIHDMRIAQRWADLNRKMIAFLICRKMGWNHRNMFTTMHNYLGDDNIIRKSAISAYNGEKVLIPMNMRDGSLICIGKGNEDWNYSAPHGAGRLMSRTKAINTISLESFVESMDGIYTTSCNSNTLDEAPSAYKPMDVIMSEIIDTVTIVDTIKPLYNFKGF